MPNFNFDAFVDASETVFAQDFKPKQGTAERRAFDALSLDEQRALTSARKSDAAREAAQGDPTQNLFRSNRPRQRPQPRDRRERR